MKKFVIIGGASRSGTNLVRRIIGSHPDIAIPNGEFKFLRGLHRGFSVRRILTAKRLVRWGVDVSDLLDAEPARAYREVLLRYAKNAGRPIAGEKTPENEFFFGTLSQWLANDDFRFVHMVRNPIDRIASLKHARFRGNPGTLKELDDLSSDWVRSVSLGLARARQEPDRYLLMRYEDLTTDPLAQCRLLCTFLGVDLLPDAMLSMAACPGHGNNTSFPEDQNTPHGAWSEIRPPRSRRSHLSGGELSRVGQRCGELALAMGYSDEAFSEKVPSRLKRRRASQRGLHWPRGIKQLRSLARRKKNQVMNRVFGQQRVAMFHAGRCGSKVLTDMLNQHPAVFWGGEIFENAMVNGRGQRGREFAKKRVEVRAGTRRAPIFGFETKHLPSLHLGPACIDLNLEEYLDLLDEMGFSKYIFLHRRNYLKLVVSASIGYQHNFWHSTDEPVEPRRVTVPVRDFKVGETQWPLVDFFEELDARYAEAQTLLARRGALNLVYEDHILHDPKKAYDLSCAYLKIKGNGPRISLKRTNPFPEGQIIENQEEVRDALGGTRFAWMMESQE
jgi:hypothetical protein